MCVLAQQIFGPIAFCFSCISSSAVVAAGKEGGGEGTGEQCEDALGVGNVERDAQVGALACYDGQQPPAHRCLVRLCPRIVGFG